jgi:hypothetical protein
MKTPKGPAKEVGEKGFRVILAFKTRIQISTLGLIDDPNI